MIRQLKLMEITQMSRKINKLLGLGAIAAFGFASSAFAQCPSSPVPPWSGVTQTQATATIVAGGLGDTSCALTTTLNTGAGSFAAATVRDDTPAAEPRYRAQFLIDADGLTSLTSFQGAYVISVQSGTAYLGSNFIIRASITGGAVKNLNIFTANEGAPGNLSSVTVPLVAGPNTVELDWTVGGGDGSLKVWVNNGTEGSPDASIDSLNNAGWVGVETVNLGLAAANNVFRTNQAGNPVKFDEFDSRRSTFIGL